MVSGRLGHDQPRLATVTLADPRVRLGLSAAAILATAAPVRTDRVGQRESRVFLAVNGLPDRLYRPTWMIMQLGAFGAVPATACAAWLAGDRRLAWRLARAARPPGRSPSWS